MVRSLSSRKPGGGDGISQVTPDMTRSVLVTGGTGALGAAITRRFLNDGHRVAVCSRTRQDPDGRAARVSNLHPRLHILQADVTDEDSVAKLVQQMIEKFGNIDVLVHLVGVWAGGRPVHEHSLETWDRIFAVNLRSAFLCSRGVLPVMREQQWGRLTFVSSQTARANRHNQGAYAIAKAGVSMLAETIAEENHDRDVTANVIAPSILDTPANRAAMPNADHASWVPLEDAAATIAFLASQEAGQLRGAWLPLFGRS